MIEEVIGRCPCGNIRINELWYDGNYINFMNVKPVYTDTVCGRVCASKYYGVECYE